MENTPDCSVEYLDVILCGYFPTPGLLASSRRFDRQADLLDMPVIGTAASADHG